MARIKRHLHYTKLLNNVFKVINLINYYFRAIQSIPNAAIAGQSLVARRFLLKVVFEQIQNNCFFSKLLMGIWQLQMLKLVNVLKRLNEGNGAGPITAHFPYVFGVVRTPKTARGAGGA